MKQILLGGAAVLFFILGLIALNYYQQTTTVAVNQILFSCSGGVKIVENGRISARSDIGLVIHDVSQRHTVTIEASLDDGTVFEFELDNLRNIASAASSITCNKKEATMVTIYRSSDTLYSKVLVSGGVK